MKKYTTIFNLRTNKEQLTIWKQRAKEVNKDLSSLIRDLLREDIERYSIADSNK